MKEKINELCAVIFIIAGITLVGISIFSYIEKTQLEIEKLKYELSIYKEQEK